MSGDATYTVSETENDDAYVHVRALDHYYSTFYGWIFHEAKKRENQNRVGRRIRLQVILRVLGDMPSHVYSDTQRTLFIHKITFFITISNTFYTKHEILLAKGFNC